MKAEKLYQLANKKENELETAMGKLQYHGKDPMLNDVMQYLWKLVEEDHENQDEILFGIGCLTNAYDNFCWNFKNPYLKDQSPELIAFLHGLIEK